MDAPHTIQPDQQLLVINFSEAVRPTYQEKKGAAGGYIEYGQDNLYPNYLLRLFDNSPKHNAIIRGKVTYITGNGFVVKDAQESESAKTFIAKANRKETLQEVLVKAAFDLEVFGAAYLQVVWGLYGRGVAEIYHTDFSKVRTNKDNTQFWYKEDWSEPRGRKITLPAFNAAAPGGSHILMLKEYRPGAMAYGLPGYLGALNHIEADIEVGKHVNNNAQNGFTASKHITLYEGPTAPDAEKKRTIEKKLKDKFTGGTGTKIIVGFAASKDQKPEIEDLGQSDISKEDFTAVDDLIQANIYAGHQITTPAIFGVATPGKLGATTEMRDGYEIFKATYVNSKQMFLERTFNMLGKLKGVDVELQITPVDPLSMFDAQTIADVMTDDEKREKAGLKPLEKPQISAAQQITDAINSLSPIVANKVLNTLTTNEVRSLANLAPIAGGDVIAAPVADTTQQMSESLTIFEQFGEARTGYISMSSRPVLFMSDADLAADEDGEGTLSLAMAMEDLSKTEQTIIDQIRKDGLIDVHGLVAATGSSEAVVKKALKSLQERGIIEVSSNGKGAEERTVNEKAPELKSKTATTTDLRIMYSYEGPQDERNRPFCAKLLELDRLYTRSDIETMSSRLGYSVFDRGGGWYNDPSTGEPRPYCRHTWKSNVVVSNG